MEAEERILLVDDDSEGREMLAEFLRGAGYNVGTADNGRAALAALAASEPDLVVTDLEMPGMDGIELIRALREVCPSCPVLLVTAQRDPDGLLARLARNLRFTSLFKPLDLDEVAATVKRMVRAHGAAPHLLAR